MEHARLAVPEDVPAIAELAREAIDELSSQRGGPLWQATLARREPIEQGLNRALGGAGCLVVGTIDAAIVGYGSLTLSEVAGGGLLATITDLYVTPAARGIGVGEAMMGLLESHARRADAMGMDSLALPGDRATKNFFETFGLKARAIVVHRSLADEPAPASEGGHGTP